eukprot:5987735-Prymnesium_polylepis.1
MAACTCSCEPTTIATAVSEQPTFAPRSCRSDYPSLARLAAECTHAPHVRNRDRGLPAPGSPPPKAVATEGVVRRAGSRHAPCQAEWPWPGVPSPQAAPLRSLWLPPTLQPQSLWLPPALQPQSLWLPPAH